MKVSGSIPCPFCDGKGYNSRFVGEKKSIKIWCEDCMGTGIIQEGIENYKSIAQKQEEEDDDW